MEAALTWSSGTEAGGIRLGEVTLLGCFEDLVTLMRMPRRYLSESKSRWMFLVGHDAVKKGLSHFNTLARLGLSSGSYSPPDPRRD